MSERTGVMPLPAAKATTSPSPRELKNPAGRATSMRSPVADESIIQFETMPPGTRLTVTRSSVVDRRGGGHRVAPDVRLAVDPASGRCRTGRTRRRSQLELGRDVEDERTGVGGLGHHLAHPDLMKAVVTHAGRVSRRLQ